MEEIRFESTTLYRKRIISTSLFFTQEERNQFFGTLKGHDKAKIEEFLDRIRAYIKIVRDIRHQQTPASHVEDLKDIMRQFKKQRKTLLKILCAPNNFRVLLPRRCDYLVEWIKNPKITDLINETRRNAEMALEYNERLLQNLTSALEMQKPNAKGGRPKADEIRFALNIARLFKRYIEIPRPHSGPFREIIKFCFKAAGIPGDDRSDAISQALKECRRLVQSPVI
jgi:hypothetical protein